MNTTKSTRQLGFAAFALGIALAPVANAQSLPVSRNTGVGLEIAAQGNRALREIRAELLAELRSAAPALPARPVLASMPAGSAASLAPGARCEK